jgi:hypothetical protein
LTGNVELEPVQVRRVRVVATINQIVVVYCANTTQFVQSHGSQEIRERQPNRAKGYINLCKCSEERIPSSSIFINIISNGYWAKVNTLK